MKKLVFLFFFIFSTFIFSEDFQQKIVVQGTGSIKTAPDRANLNFTVLTMDVDPSKSGEANRKIMEKVEETFKALNISKENITTVSYNISREADGEKQDNFKYFTRNSLSVTIENIDKVGQIIAALEKAGVNMIQGVSFYSSKTDSLESEVLVKAYKNALEKAEAIAKAIGYKVTPLEIVSDYYQPRPMFMAASSGESKSSVQIYAPQSLDFTGSLRVTFLMTK